MAKRDLVIVNDEDGGVTLTPANKKNTGDSPNPIDPDTGETTFDDMDSRFNMPAPKLVGQEDEEESAEELEELFPRDKKPKAGDAEEEDEDEDETLDPVVDEDEDEDEPVAPRGGVKGRIAREQRLRREAEDNARDLKERVDALERRDNERADDAKFSSTQSELNSKIEATRKALVAAKEAGNTEDEVRLSEELLDLKVEQRSSKKDYDEAKAAREKRGTVVSPIVLRKVSQWQRKHPKFERDPVFNSFALGVDRSVKADGYDPETDEYWAEVDRRVAERYPEEYKGQKLNRERPANRHPSQNARREGDGARRPLKKQGEFEVSKDGRVKLSKLHVQTMKTFNLDPDNAEDVREFVRNNQ